MNDKFFDLKKEKQDRMINAALKVFAINGYGKASTDDIVKEAGISKGLLFHYFGSKAGTYIFAYEYSARYMAMELERAVPLREKDLFILLSQVEEARAVLLRNYPFMQKFLLTFHSVQDEEIRAAIGEYVEMVPKAIRELYDRADMERILPGVDTELLVRSMNYVTRGLMEEAVEHEAVNVDFVLSEAIGYLDMMRQRFTKPEFLKEDYL